METEEIKNEATLYGDDVVIKRPVVGEYLTRADYVGKKTFALIKGIGNRVTKGKSREFIILQVENVDFMTDLSGTNKAWLFDNFGQKPSAWKGKGVYFTCVPTTFKQGEEVKSGFELNLSL